MKKYLIILLFYIPFNLYADKIDKEITKLFTQGNEKELMFLISKTKPEDIKLSSTLLLCGRFCHQYGLFEDASKFYMELAAKDLESFKEQDALCYFHSLLNSGKESEFLTNKYLISKFSYSHWVEKLVQTVHFRDSLKKELLKPIKSTSLSLNFLSKNGIFYYNDSLYFSKSPYNTPSEEALLYETSIIQNRLAQHSYIYKGKITDSNTLENIEIEKRSINKNKNISLLTKGLKGPYYSVSAQSSNTINITTDSKTLPPFTFNSLKYNCAMPFYDEARDRLYFCSDMPGGCGGWDIYYCMLSEGKWSAPVNMGTIINSNFDELFPTIIDDMMSFSSNGGNNIGKLDNFIFNFSSNQIHNLSFINTIDDDFSLNFVNTAPFNAVGIQGNQIKVYKSDKSLKELLKTQERPKEDIVAEKEDNIPKLEINPAIFRNEKPVAEKINNQEKEKTITPKIDNPEIKKIGTINFDINSAIFKSENYLILDDIVNKILDDNIINITVWGYTDKIGAERYNDYLSYQRALGIVEYLKSKLSKFNNRLYFTVVAGEKFSKNEISPNERKSEIYSTNIGFSYDLIYSYNPDKEVSLKDIATLFNNNIESMQKINSMANSISPTNKTILVGIRKIHIVKPGESIYRLSTQYHCSIEQLKTINKKKDNILLIGEKIIIPLQ